MGVDVTAGSNGLGATALTLPRTVAGTLGFYGTAPIAQQGATPAAAVDLATALALVNDLRAKLLALGLIA